MAAEPLSYACWPDSPLGAVFLLAREGRLCRIILGRREEECRAMLRHCYRGEEPLENEKALARPLAQLREYFRGERRSFELPLQLEGATPFQKRVWELLRRIPYGQVRSYKWVAGRLGMPQAPRAVGMANRCNPLPIVIPCHRVIRADGRLGGYSGGGEPIKQALLQLEGAPCIVK